ncbi:MAG: MFS transporter [Spirochaetales bacterium]|nr:MFS transporter [Spirochaetales bacterium]
MSRDITQRKVRFFNIFAYGLADLYGGGAFFIVTTFSMFYLVNVVGLHPILAGLIPAIGKLWDAFNDPFMGYISDITPKNRFGKRRVWFLASILPVFLTFMLIWFPTNIASQLGKFFFYLFAYIFFYTVTTMSYVPYAALAAEMTNDAKERNKLVGSRIFFSFVATLLAGLIAKPIIDMFDGGKSGYLYMGIIFGIIFAFPWLLLYFGTWELPQQERAKDKTHFFVNFLSLFKNKSCRIHIAMYVCSFGTLDIIMSWLLFYFIDYLNMDSSVSLGFMTLGKFTLLQGTLLLTMMAAIPFYVFISGKKGHAKSYIIGLSIVLVGMIFMAFQTPSSPFWLLLLNMLVLGFGISAGSLIPHQLMPFVVDVDKLFSGKDRAGTYSSAMTLTRKLFLGLFVLNGLGLLLSGIGYKQPVPTVLTQEQFAEAKDFYFYKAIGSVISDSSEKQDTEIRDANDIVFEAAEKITVHADKIAFLESSYLLLEDGNYHLNYFKYDVEKLVTGHLMVGESQSYKKLSEEDYNKVVSSYPRDKISDLRKVTYIEKSYNFDGENYIFDESLANFMNEQELIELRKVLNDADFKYSGIGDTQKISQASLTIGWIRILFITLPIIMVIAGLIAATFFRLTPKNHKIVLAELDRLNNGGTKADAEPRVKHVIELLTGSKYE